MKKTPGILLFCLSVLWCGTVYSQVNLKLNCLCAVAGVINPQAEFVLSNHSSMSLDVTYSPWRSINGRHANFGIFTGEYRYYVGRHRASGFYVSGHAGMMGFDISKPRMFSDGKFISFKDGYSKGFGVILGIGIGYQHEFCRRWVVDAFLGASWLHSWYNGYSKDGGINMTPNHTKPTSYDDPFNMSGEFLPTKIGVSIGYRIFDPARHRGVKPETAGVGRVKRRLHRGLLAD